MDAGSRSTSVIVSGASGMLGAALRQELAARSIPTVQLVREVPIAAGQLQWDPTATPAIAHPAPLEGHAAAIHLSGANVGAHRWTKAWRHELVSSRVETTHALAVALADLHSPPRVLVTASAIGYYGDRGDELLTEESAPGEGFLADLCRRWEAATQPAVDAGMRVVHMRFGVVLGKGHGALEKMLPPFRLGLGGKLGNGRQWTPWISLKDAVAGTLYAMDTPSLCGAVNVTSPDPIRNVEFTRALAHQLGKPAVFTVPAFALKALFGEMANETLLASVRVSAEKLKRAGFRYSHCSIEDALAAALA